MKSLASRTLKILLAWLCVGSNVFAEVSEKQVGAAQAALTSEGTFYVTWTSDPDPIPLNEMFEIHFKVFRADDHETLVSNAMVTASAWMPLHKHSTTLQPQVESHGDGTATARGFLLHMQGAWELRVGVASDGQMERANFAIDLEP
ncbi:MAG: hypothetical protein SGI99_15960 [Pseudomonadota bacterium]|nr:hypothetical protein [Pseudomonadota bacterium]